MKRLLAAVMLAAAVLTGCVSTRYVPVETVRTEWRDREVEKLVTDSVVTERLVWVSGDTIREWRDRWRTRVVEIRDTMTEVRVDTITKVVEVERKLSRWEEAKMDFGGAGIGISLALIVVMIIMLRRK